MAEKRDKPQLPGVRLNQHADKFGDRRTKRERDRSNKERKVIEREMREE
jgi:single-stranded DNA-specific DHH superfamily exonuclease